MRHSFDELEVFESDQTDVSDFSITLTSVASISRPEPDMVIGEECCHTDENNTATVWNKSGNTTCTLHIAERQAEISYLRCVIRCDIKQQISIAVSSFLAENAGFFMHGPILKHKGQGIVFTAPSGGGKSTQANYWVDCFSDELLNGDKALVRMIDGKPFAFGSPWGGSSFIYKNESVPLKAVVLIDKADENRVERITDAGRILSILAPNIYYPYWNESLVDHTMDTMDDLIGKVSFWVLHCRNEKESAILAERFIFAEDCHVDE